MELFFFYIIKVEMKEKAVRKELRGRRCSKAGIPGQKWRRKS